MRLLHFGFIVLFVQILATHLSSCIHQRAHVGQRQDFEYKDNYGDDDPEGSLALSQRAANWRSRILATKASSEWRMFKRTFRKYYTSNSEEDERVANYLSRKDFIERHNSSPGQNFKLVINHFADRYDEELDRMNGFISSNISHEVRSKGKINPSLANFLDKPAPESWDWREHDGILTQVRAQGECGSCWAFVTAALLEGQQRKIGMQSTELSAQQLLDCEDKYSFGCDGGFIHAALGYIAYAGGIEGWASYPYEGRRFSCRAEPDKFVMKGGEWVDARDLNEEDMKKLVVHYGPVAVSIRARRDYFFWGGGVYDKCDPGEKIDHAVLLVGYGQDGENPYWLIKNTWGKTWGEGGYGKFKRGVNMCGVMEQPIIVLLKSEKVE